MDIMTMLGGTSCDAADLSFLRARVPATTLAPTGGEVRPLNVSERTQATTLIGTWGRVRPLHARYGSHTVTSFPKPVSGTRRSRGTPV